MIVSAFFASFAGVFVTGASAKISIGTHVTACIAEGTGSVYHGFGAFCADGRAHLTCDRRGTQALVIGPVTMAKLSHTH